MPVGIKPWLSALAAATLLTGCATNGELGFAGHPLDCAVGFKHSDCAVGTLGYQQYYNGGPPMAGALLAAFAAGANAGTAYARPASNPTMPLSPQFLPTPLAVTGTVQGNIDGEYHGWDGETVYSLNNGQVWQQASYAYRYHYAFAPSVLIYSANGGFKMRVAGDTGDDIAVRRLR